MNMLMKRSRLRAASAAIRCIAACLQFALTVVPALAHKPSDSYLTLRVGPDALTGRWDLALRDLDGVFDLDRNRDDRIDWGEVRVRRDEIDRYAVSRLLVSAGRACALRVTDQAIDRHSDGAYLVGSTWTPMTAIGAPSARLATVRDSGWVFAIRPGVIAIVGGQTALNGTLAHDGATYDASVNAWEAIPTWPSNEDHRNGIGVWTGSEFVLWSGRTGGAPTPTGERIAF